MDSSECNGGRRNGAPGETAAQPLASTEAALGGFPTSRHAKKGIEAILKDAFTGHIPVSLANTGLRGIEGIGRFRTLEIALGGEFSLFDEPGPHDPIALRRTELLAELASLEGK